MSDTVHGDTSDKIDKFATKYLLENLKAEFYAPDFLQTHFDTLLKALYEHFDEERVNPRISVVGTSIQKHFVELSQDCEVTIVKGKIKVKNKLQDGVKTAEEDKAFIGLRSALKELVEQKHEYEVQSHLLNFPEKNLNEIYTNFVSTPLAKDKKKLRELVRTQVEKDFELQTKDIVLFLRKQLYIRYFVDMRCLSNDENRRFLGMAAEELEELYEKSFPENFEDILLDMAPDVISDALDFSRIDNFAFKTKYIEVFRTLIDVAMIEYTKDLDTENTRAMNGYVLRLHFDSLLYLCAQMLVELVMKRDRKADEFLRFYNGETLVNKAGKNIKKPFISDEKGNHWNYSSIFSIMTQSGQYETQHKNQLKLIKEAKEQHEMAESSLVQSKQIHKKDSETLSLLKDELHACSLMKESLNNMKSPSKEDDVKLNYKRQEEKRLLNKHDKAFSQHNESSFKLDNAKVLEKNRLKQLESSKLALVTLEKKGLQLDIQQDNIFSALAKALIFR